jgi:hypothetical protein
MDPTLQKLLPAALLLVVGLAVVILLALRLDRGAVASLLTGGHSATLGAILLFWLVCVVHLFDSESWTADLLKVIVGALVGAGAAKSGKQDLTNLTQSAVGENIRQAGRDLVEQMHGDIKGLTNSVVNLQSKVSSLSDRGGAFRKGSFALSSRTTMKPSWRNSRQFGGGSPETMPSLGLMNS